MRFALDRVGQLSVTFGVKVLSDSRLRDAYPRATSVEQKELQGRCKVPFEPRHLLRIGSIFYAANSKLP